MEKQISLTIDGRLVSVPEGTNIVDAAKKIGINIPVFCHHPKLKPVGMCRICLVDVGRPQFDRATNSVVLNEDGSTKIIFGPKLETACSTPVSEGMVVWGATEKVMSARKEVIEFLLTSHPLDCPVCDKGGECPLQNQTITFGSAESRFYLEDKSRSNKHYPLGNLINLDRERCIQCARCVRFQDQIAGDGVIGFYNRGRALEIATFSDPGFDSIFSGNTTDICPVGALTTVDFRFGARAWELKHKPSLCVQCPVGCNLTYDVRREAENKGKIVIKRVMPRQNEEVNEIWLCDKGRFSHTFVESEERLTQPLVRKNGNLTPVEWEEAIHLASEKVLAAGNNLLALVSGHLPLEDLYVLKTLMSITNGKISLYSDMGGGEWVTRLGLTPGSDLAKLNPPSTIIVFASDLHEEAPIWWLRVKQAAERGVNLVVANARTTRLDKFASHKVSYKYGQEESAVRELFENDSDLSKLIDQAENLVVFFGSDGMGLEQTSAIAGLFAERLVKNNHFGKPNNGLIGVWPRANDQGAYELGIHPDKKLAENLCAAMGVYVAGADPAGDDPNLREALQRAGFVIVQDLFLTETAKLADIVFPIQTTMEREGTLVSGERRLQKFSAAIPALKGTKTDFNVTRLIFEKATGQKLPATAEELFDTLGASVSTFQSLSYQQLGETHEQWPRVGRNEIYYGGTGYENCFGLGITLPAITGGSDLPKVTRMPDRIKPGASQWMAFPVTKLYNGSRSTSRSILKSRVVPEILSIHPEDAQTMGITPDSIVFLTIFGQDYETRLKMDAKQPKGILIVARNSGIPIHGPEIVDLTIKPAAFSDLERGTR
ncbi:MAG: NADH-quinone oxidoreductase subunit NuoG [Chloroflexi bacterium]|nr:NADH-quinone oxidoreductase subunit NuoG [Chloroflexota bacterium]